MAAVRLNWAGAIAAAMLLAGMGRLAPAQGLASGSLSGKLTDVHSKPLSQATVTLRNEDSGAEIRTTTTRNGSYRFASLPPGDYTLEAASATLGHGKVQGIVVAARNEARVRAAIDFEPEPATPVPPEAEASAALPITRLHPFNQAGSPAGSADKPELGIVALDAKLPAEPLILLPLPERVQPASIDPLPHVTVPGGLNSSAVIVPPYDSTNTTRIESGPATTPVTSATVPSTELEAKNASSIRPINPAAPAPELIRLDCRAALQSLAAASIRQAAFQVTLPPQSNIDAADSQPLPATTSITGEQLQSLPLAGRHWEDFVLDAPTVGSSEEESRSSRAGPLAESPAITVDGSTTRLAFGGRSGKNMRSSSPLGSGASEAAIGTARSTEEDQGAIYGSPAAVQTRQGSHGLHGQAFLFEQQNLWGAQNPFTQWVKETEPATLISTPVFTPVPFTPPDRDATWGIGVGGSLHHDRLFWFAALDSNHRNDPGVASVKHPDDFFAQPSNDQMQVLSAQLRLSSVNPVAEGLAAYSKMLETLDGLLGPAPRTATEWVGFGRLDWQAAERHRFTLEGSGATWNSPGGGLTRTSETYGNHSFGTSRASETSLLGRWEAFVTPNLLTVTQGSLGRQIFAEPAESPSAFEQTLDVNTWGQLPQVVVDSRYGFTIGNPARFGSGSYPDEHIFEVQQGLDWIRGPLLLKAGFSVSHNLDNTSLLRNHTGTYHYANVENFASDALVFAAYGLSDALDPMNQHNCDQTGKAWRDAAGQLHGLGYLPCYSYYTQTLGPTDWYLSTNDWAGYVTTQWQPAKPLVFSASLRWEREQLPPPIILVANPELPMTAKLPSLGNEWGPRASLAWGKSESRWPVLRLGYGLYFGRTQNSVLETALTQTGSLKGDLNFFMRPTDNLSGGGVPPFPYVLAGDPATIEKPGAVEFSSTFRNAEVHQGMLAMDETLPGHVIATASAAVSLARHLPVSIDTNFDPSVNPGTVTYGVVDASGKGPLKTPQITVPFFASWPSDSSIGGRLNPDYQQITELISKANSTYEAATIRLSRNARRGLSFHARYTYAHAMDWNPDESSQVSGSSVFDPTNFSQEYGTSDLDVRHSASLMTIWQTPWKLHSRPVQFANGWMLSGIGHFSSGLPYTMRTDGSIPKEFQSSGAVVVGLGPGMNGYGGDNRVYGVGRNTYRYPSTWKADLRLGKDLNLGHDRQLQLFIESFNLFNHQNVTELETTGYSIEPGSVSGGFPTLNFLTGLKSGQTEFGQPLDINATDFFRARQIDFGMRMRF